MKKRNLTLLMLGFVALSLMVCGDLKAAAPARSQTGGEMREVQIAINGKQFTAEIEDNADTKQIFAKLPMELSMSKLNGANLLYGGSFVPAMGQYRKGFRKGELALCHADYFIVFYDNQPNGHSSEYRPIGRIVSGLGNLNSVADGGRLHMEIRPAKAGNEEADKNLLVRQYDETLRYMVGKDTEKLSALMTDVFVLVHMTGMRQSKSEYLRSIRDGELNYISAETDDVKVELNGDKALLTGQSRVTAEVFGGSRNTWRLQLAFDMEKANGKWLQTGCKASTY